MQRFDDSEIIRQCLGGRPQAFAGLVSRYKNQVFSLIRRLIDNPTDAEDVAQETFIKAYKGLASFDPARSFASWLFAIAHHAAIDFLRARKPRAISIDEEGFVEPAEASPALDVLTGQALRQDAIVELFSSLPPLYREILFLRHKEMLDYKEIADVLNLPAGTVKIRLFRARQMLRAWKEII
ncbi:MAG: sigma-70 family RNA polymerase sigma factor [Elusimicrobia bacterium]|nr:sigma-70 family RNA polymerase sigma factor [Elusimicrobiota bacterium]